jgi:uncharacterized repeat protein (TIGR03809 family)
MTLRSDVGRSRDLLACWRELAEKRLEYLTEMFESGRWRRYYSEFVFLENIKEAKIAVETWRGLSTPDPTRNCIIDISWSAPERVARPRQTPPRPQPIAAEPPKIPVAAKIPVAVKAEHVPPDEASAAPVIDLLALERALDGPSEAAPDTDAGAIERYLLLRQSR